MSSELWHRQVAFVRAKGKLIAYAESHGIELTDGDAYRDPRVHGEMGEKFGYGGRPEAATNSGWRRISTPKTPPTT